MTTNQHVRRLGLLIVAASVLLWWLTAHTDVFFADGLRYIAQARAIDQGSWARGSSVRWTIRFIRWRSRPCIV